jgi:hypothetical protein
MRKVIVNSFTTVYWRSEGGVVVHNSIIKIVINDFTDA